MGMEQDSGSQTWTDTVVRENARVFMPTKSPSCSCKAPSCKMRCVSGRSLLGGMQKLRDGGYDHDRAGASNPAVSRKLSAFQGGAVMPKAAATIAAAAAPTAFHTAASSSSQREEGGRGRLSS